MKHWIFAEKLNGRLAMIGLVAAVVNYGFTGWNFQFGKQCSGFSIPWVHWSPSNIFYVQ